MFYPMESNWGSIIYKTLERLSLCRKIPCCIYVVATKGPFLSKVFYGLASQKSVSECSDECKAQK